MRQASQQQMNQKQLIDHSTYEQLSQQQEDLLNQAFIASSDSFLITNSHSSLELNFQMSEVSSIHMQTEQIHHSFPLHDFSPSPALDFPRKFTESEWAKWKEQKCGHSEDRRYSKKVRMEMKKVQKMNYHQFQREEDREWLRKLLEQIDKFQYS